MVPAEIVIGTVSSPLEMWGQIANIVIAVGTVGGVIFSVWYSVRNLRHSVWSSNMSTVPTLTIACTRLQFWLSDGAGGGGSWGEPTRYLDPTEKYITTALEFSITNQGRGVALGIDRPKVSCKISNRIREARIPVSMGHTADESGSFEIYFTEKHTDWLRLMNEPVAIHIEVEYKNDQGNILCSSAWNAELKPFDVEANRLNIRDYGQRVRNQDMRVNYSPVA